MVFGMYFQDNYYYLCTIPLLLCEIKAAGTPELPAVDKIEKHTLMKKARRIPNGLCLSPRRQRRRNVFEVFYSGICSCSKNARRFCRTSTLKTASKATIVIKRNRLIAVTP
jgi:hypothetical protein